MQATIAHGTATTLIGQSTGLPIGSQLYVRESDDGPCALRPENQRQASGTRLGTFRTVLPHNFATMFATRCSSDHRTNSQHNWRHISHTRFVVSSVAASAVPAGAMAECRTLCKIITATAIMRASPTRAIASPTLGPHRRVPISRQHRIGTPVHRIATQSRLFHGRI